MTISGLRAAMLRGRWRREEGSQEDSRLALDVARPVLDKKLADT